MKKLASRIHCAKHTVLLFAGALWGDAAAFGHGWSPELKAEFNSPAPEWLKVGSPIKAYKVDSWPPTGVHFRSVSGGARCTKMRVFVPSQKIEIVMDRPIAAWWASNAVSLNPNGKHLAINSGDEFRAIELLEDGRYSTLHLQVPHVTYDDGPKGFIGGWVWAADDTLIGAAEIDTERGEYIENRLYVFHMAQSILSRIDLNLLSLPTLKGLEVSKVGSDLNHLMISVGGDDLTIKADLRSPVQIDKSGLKAPATYNANKTKSVGSIVGTIVQTTWLRWVVFASIFFGLLGMMWNSRK